MGPHPSFYLDKEIFLKILVYERRLRHRELRKKVNPTREFYTGDIMILRKQAKSIIKDRISHKSVFKTKGLYRFLEKVTPISYWLNHLNFCEGLGRP